MSMRRGCTPAHWSGALALLLLATVCLWGCRLPFGATSTVPVVRPLAATFSAAAVRFGVPQPLLEAVSYVETRWNPILAGTGYGRWSRWTQLGIRQRRCGHLISLC
jgi:hypothetical protein